MSRVKTILLLLKIVLAALLFFSPLLWMKIGPGGYEYYGPTVPDVYIYGNHITGKDLDWKPIDFSWKFQATVILVYISLCFLLYFRLRAGKNGTALFWIMFGLVLLFPFWFLFYANHVHNNSDCAELTWHLQYGWIFYGVLLLVNVLWLIHWLRQSN